MITNMRRFVCYRRDMDSRETHNEKQKNPEGEAQYEGVIWSDGTVTLHWRTPLRSHSVWDSIGDCLGVHGHPEYGTEIIWLDGDPPEIINELKAEVDKRVAERVTPDLARIVRKANAVVGSWFNGNVDADLDGNMAELAEALDHEDYEA